MRSGARPGPGNFDTSFGNASFGAWVNDEFGLPAYRYDGCSTSTCTEPTNAFHQLGNGSVTARASTDGYVELFTAKTYYRFANRYDAASKNYAGGFGWVRDGDTVWSTLYPDRPQGAAYQRQFGMGYYKKTIEHNGLRLEQYIYAAPDGDEALLERLVFTNLSGAAKSISYFSYWDVAWWLVYCKDKVPLVPVCSPSSGYDPAQVTSTYDPDHSALKLKSDATAGDPNVPSLIADPSPKTAFVAFLGEAPDRCEIDQGAFFGNGDRKLPERVRSPGTLEVCAERPGSLPNQHTLFATEKRLELLPGSRRELHILYGLAPRDAENAVIKRYQSAPANRLQAVMQGWASRIPAIDLPEHRWIAREMAWSTYYLLSGMMREDYFDARVANQGSIYQYVWGANAGPRSALRHVLPLIYLEPQAAREVIIYYLRAMRSTGELSYATAGYGGWKTMGFSPSDSGLWLLWAAAEYVNATRDFAFLDTEHNYYCDTGRGGCGKATAYTMLTKAYEYQRDTVGVGSHGLVRLMHADWDDALLLLTLVHWHADFARSIELGESTLNTALAVVAYPMFAALSERRGEGDYAAAVRQRTAELSAKLLEQWRGKFLNRAYLYTFLGMPVEVGHENLWLAANGVALLADPLLTTARAGQLVERMRNDLLAPSPLGLASQGVPVRADRGTPGFWYSLAGPALEGLAKRRDVAGARELAWEAFRRQTLAAHAQAYPDLWYGVWSGPDMYFTPLDANPQQGDHAGMTWCLRGLSGQPSPQLCMRDVPITNMFAHSEPLLGSVRMAGLWADARGLVVDPAFPSEYNAFTWKSRAFSVLSTANETKGHITPSGNDVLELRVRVRHAASPTDLTVSVNGQPAAFTFDAGTDFVHVPLQVTKDVETTWSVGTSG